MTMMRFSGRHLSRSAWVSSRSRRYSPITRATTQQQSQRSTAVVSLSCATAAAAVVAFKPLTLSSCEQTTEDLYKEWDDFYAKSVKPGEEDDDEDEDEEDEEDEEEENEEEEDDTEGETVEQVTDMPTEGKNDLIEEEEVAVPESKASSEEKIDKDLEVEAVEKSVTDESPVADEAAPDVATEMKEPTAEKSIPDDDDKYENLPDEDEPTSCSICRINRKGPCRFLWRKFEACMKDNMTDNKQNTSESSVSSPNPAIAERCDKYMMPWITCFQEYRNFYTLATNELYRKDFLDEAEAAVPKEHCRSLEDPDIDWTAFLQFLQDEEMTITDMAMAKTAIDVGPNQSERLDVLRHSMRKAGLEFQDKVLVIDEDNPQFLCDCQARISLKEPNASHELPIEVAYARDQDGNILGFDMFTSAKEAKGNKEQESGVLNFHIRFGSTLAIQICSIYQEVDPKDGTVVERRLYQSDLIPVTQPARKAGLFKDEKPISFPTNIMKK